MQPVQGNDGQWYVQGPHGWVLYQPPQQQPQGFNGFNNGNAGYGQQQMPFNGYGGPQPSFQTPAGTPQNMAHVFAGLDGADPSGGARYPFFLKGSYKLEIRNIKFVESRKGKNYLVVEAMVKESNVPERSPGTMCSGFIDMSNKDTRDKNVKRFLCGVLGVNPEGEQAKAVVAPDGRAWQAHMYEALDASNPWSGRPVGLVAVDIETEAGNDFTLLNWVPYNQVEIPAMQAPVTKPAGSSAMLPPQGAPAGAVPSSPSSAGGPPGFAPPGMPYQPGPQGQPQFAPQGQPQQPQFAPQGQPQQPQFAPQGQPQQPQFAPQGQPGHPGQFAPQGQPQQPQSAPQGQPGPGWSQYDSVPF